VFALAENALAISRHNFPPPKAEAVTEESRRYCRHVNIAYTAKHNKNETAADQRIDRRRNNHTVLT